MKRTLCALLGGIFLFSAVSSFASNYKPQKVKSEKLDPILEYYEGYPLRKTIDGTIYLDININGRYDVEIDEWIIIQNGIKIKGI